jgi:nucleotide-binding universal stress UspA family protein
MTAAAIVPIVPAIQLKKVLYATDFSEGSNKVLPVLSAIARHYGAKIVAVHISSPHSYPMATPEAVLVLDKRREREAQEELDKVVREMEASGASVTPIVKTGEPVEALERIARDQGIDLAILSTHGRVGMKRMLMGSVAESLFRRLPCPVLTVGPHLASRFRNNVNIKNILFATDLSPESRTVFPHLASLAHEYGAKITLLHVLPAETESNPDALKLPNHCAKKWSGSSALRSARSVKLNS